MNCQQFELRWNELLDSRENSQADVALQEHLRQCVDCRSLAAAHEVVLETMDAWRVPEPSIDLTEKILRAVRASRPARHWTALKIAAALTTAAAITVACWPALFPPQMRLAQPGPLPAPAPAAVPAPGPEATEPPAEPAAPPIGALAQEASARYQELARATRDWSNLGGWVPTLDVSPGSSGEPDSLSAATDWMGDVTDGLEPMTQSTSATLQSFLQAFPAEAPAAAEERAS